MVGNDFAVVACYQDGLYIYDVSIPGSASLSGYFDTHPQGGASVDNYFGADYRGTWGAYPWLPSKIIIAQDMQNGVFLLDATAAFGNRASLQNQTAEDETIVFYPNPASDILNVSIMSASSGTLSLINMLGGIVLEKHYNGVIKDEIDLKHIQGGSYLVVVKSNNGVFNKKIVIYK
jgi:hypothetical protein